MTGARLFASALCVAFALLAREVATSAVDAHEDRPSADTAFDLAFVDWVSSRSQRALEHALEALVGLDPSRARLVPLGRGRDGRALLAVEIGPERAPGVVVLPLPEKDRLTSADAALALAHTWLTEPPSAARVVFVVGIRPDLHAPQLPELGFDLARNFPVDWDLALHAGGGPYPLAAPETRALAQWLDGDPLLHSALVLGAEALSAEALWLGDPVADGELATLLAAPPLAELVAGALDGPMDGEPPFGGLARHARLRAGLAVAAVTAEAPQAALLAALRALVAAGPVLEFVSVAAPRSVGPGIWQIDATLRSRGVLGTGNAAHHRGRLPRGLALGVDGGQLAFGALRRGAEAGYTVVQVGAGPAGESRLQTGDLAAGATLDVRLVVRAERGDEVVLTASTPRAAPLRAEPVRLR